MFYPTLSQLTTSSDVTDTFVGYNHNLKISTGEFYDTKNLTTDYYPMLANRAKRSILPNKFTKLQAIIAKDSLYWVDNGTMYANGYKTGLTGLQTEKETQLVSMGAYICIFPDNKYINTQDLTDYGDMGADWQYSGTAVYTMCNQDGEYYDDVTSASTEPENPANGAVWIDVTDNSVKVYSSYTQTWTILETVYTRVDFTTMGQLPGKFSEYDGVEISGLYYDDLNGSKILYAVGGDESTSHDYIVVIGIQGCDKYTQDKADIRIRRVVPTMDYVCEAQNRLWGCFYGNDGAKNINEIYCCALGDFKNWSQYLGISTDSWRASRGSDGKFTGCINYLGTPTFFKESVIHPVTVSSVGAHQITDIPARGVQEGSHKSLAVVNETLYYKARTGVMAYQGGMPVDVSEALGNERYYNAVSGAFGDKYYISMEDVSGESQLFCYDAQKGLWIHEDGLNVEYFTQSGDELYAQSENQIIAINGTIGTEETSVEWEAESGILYYEYPSKKYTSRYDIRLNMGTNAELNVFIEYDSSGVWTYFGKVVAKSTGTTTIPIRPRRCDHMRLKISGKGNIRIFSIACILKKGSDV